MVVGWIRLLAPAVAGAAALDVRNAIPAAQTFQRDRPRLNRESEAELRRVRTGTTDHVEAALRLDVIAAGQGGDHRVPGARQDLDAAHPRRHALTGHRPR
uniref:Secreted protein n=1 Tax=Streptomyces sp. NBC_00008 TaxID=2903610 RepID=A0AAU2VUA3_9ACTN